MCVYMNLYTHTYIIIDFKFVSISRYFGLDKSYETQTTY